MTSLLRSIWRRVRWRVALGWLGASLGAMAACWILYLRDEGQIEWATKERESARGAFIVKILSQDLGSAAADLAVLARSDDLQDCLEGGNLVEFGRYDRDMLHLMQAHPAYDTIRFLDERGRERAVVSQGRGIIATDAMRSGVAQDYFVGASSLAPGRIYITPLALDAQAATVSQPPKSRFHLATPVFDSRGHRRGVLAIEYLGSSLVGKIESLVNGSGGTIGLLNAEGAWLSDDKPLPPLSQADPELWARIVAHAQGQVPYLGGWFTWQRLEPGAVVGAPPKPGTYLVVASRFTVNDWILEVHRHRQSYTVLGASLLMTLGLGAWILDSRVRERRKTEAALRLAHDNAQESARLKAQFLANMSHEIRTPLNGIVGMIGLLLDTKLSPEQRSYADTARSSSEALLTLINDILDFSKIEAGQLVFERIAFDLREPVENCLGLLAERAHAKNIELAYLVEESVPTALVGDPNRLHQVLVNLIGNAVKFTDRGEVVLRVAKESEGAGRVRLCFSVRDTGVGISAEVQARLFQPFVQADSSTTRKFGGSGLGLAICRQLVTLMEGEIGVVSELGSGATFWFTAEFPLREATPKIIARKADLAGRRGLVVDDNATNREILTRQLAGWKIEARAAADGEEALTLLRVARAAGEPFQFAILDMQMGGLSGLEVAQAVVADPALAGLKVVILTSIGRTITRPELDAAGVAACLTKPARQSQLRDVLSDVLGDAPAAGEAVVDRLVVAHPARPTAEVGLRILIAEDHKVNQEVARLQLEKLGYRPDMVASGREAVEAATQRRYDVIFMDCQMPDLDGFAATRLIRAWERDRRDAGDLVRSVHIVAMTANAMSGDRELCLEAGMQDYLTKPVRSADLAGALARAQMQSE